MRPCALIAAATYDNKLILSGALLDAWFYSAIDIDYPVFADSPPQMANLGGLEVAKYLISVGSIPPAQPKSAVVKTYPIPTIRFRPLDSPGHVSAKDPAQEGR